MTNGCILALEYIPSHKQSLFGMISQIIWSISISFVGMLAYFIRDWDTLQMIGSIPSFLSLVLILIVSESPRWLISSGKFDELDILVKRHIKRSNMKAFMELSDILNKLRSNAENAKMQSRIKYSKRYYPWDILKSKYLTLWTGILTVTWIYGITATYSLNFITTMVVGNPYFTFCSSSFLDGIAIIFSFFCLKFSRNLTVFSLQMTSCLCFVISGLLSENIKYVTTILIVFGKMALNGSQFIISISGIYIYPSTLRIFGVSISCTIGKLAAISSPYFVELFKSGRWLLTTILGMCSMLVGILNVFYPDWINQPLSETIEDVENLKSSTGFLRHRKEPRIILTTEREN
uniref:Slc22a-4 n=1 Tax=Schmidtea mediterranea TaxID=79327 RepID=A0A0H3YFC7_SCHMD|nr:slc22a-4 [Schmidtea mediterranea]